MAAWFRAGFAAALFVFVSAPAAADKAFQDDALDNAAITLEADLKNESGTVELPLRRSERPARTSAVQRALDSSLYHTRHSALRHAEVDLHFLQMRSPGHSLKNALRHIMQFLVLR